MEKEKQERTVSASNFIGTMAANVDNKKLSDAEFRELFRNTLPIVIYEKGISEKREEIEVKKTGKTDMLLVVFKDRSPSTSNNLVFSSVMAIQQWFGEFSAGPYEECTVIEADVYAGVLRYKIDGNVYEASLTCCSLMK